jgi:hypothetical protein
MSAFVPKLRANVSGQVLRHTPSVYQASATYELHDMRRDEDAPAADRVLGSGSGTLYDFDTTTNATAGPGTANALHVPVVSTSAGSGVYIDKREPMVLQIVAPNGASELFHVDGFVADNYVLAKAPLAGTYPNGSTVRAISFVTAAIPDAVVDDEQRLQGQWPMRVVWTYANGERHQQQVVLVRHDFGDVDEVAVLRDIRQLFPDIEQRLEQHGHPTLPDFVDAEYRQLRSRHLDRGQVLERFLAGEQGHWALVWGVLFHCAALGHGRDRDLADTTWLDHCRDNRDMFWLALTEGVSGKETMHTDVVSDTALPEGAHYNELIKLI